MKPVAVQLIDSFREGGSERQALQLARMLRQSGRFSVRIVSLNADGPLRTELEESSFGDIRSYPLRSFRHCGTARQLWRLAAQLRAEKAAIVHTHCYYTNVFGMTAAALAGVPVRIASRRESSKRRGPERRLERLAYRLAQIVIANCEEVRRQLVTERVSGEKVVTLYNGLDPRRVEPEASLTREAALERLGLPNDGSRFVTIVANLREVKDHSTFIRSAQTVAAAVPESRFVIAGEGQLLPVLSRFAFELGIGGRTFFLGRCNRVAELLHVSDVCVLTSRSEGFSNSVLEYMAARRPVVATDAGGIREAFDDGVAGFIVPRGDSGSLAARIVYLLRNPETASAMGQRGRAIIDQKFLRGTQLAKIEKLYDGLLRTTRRIQSVAERRRGETECG
jgi:glycosyltransferase involved in cell wall biosynthesis